MPTLEPIERLEAAIEAAEAMPRKTIPVRSTLCEIFRMASRGFTPEAASYWAERLEQITAE